VTQLRVGIIGLLLGFGLVLALVRDLRVRAALVALMARTTRPAASSSASTPQIHSAFLSCADPGSAPDAPHDVPVGTGDDLQVHPVLLVLAGLERPVGGEPADRDERAVEDDVSVPSPSCVSDRGAELPSTACVL
jgi:hypothetical protein